jgi:hypothetical protein
LGVNAETKGIRMTEETAQLPRPNNIGKVRKIKSIHDKPVTFSITDEIVVAQGAGKLIYFQQLLHTPGNRIEYRLCYYMLGVKESRRGRWVFGQYALMVPANSLVKLLSEARKRGWKGIA